MMKSQFIQNEFRYNIMSTITTYTQQFIDGFSENN